jgi:hypothetical protein
MRKIVTTAIIALGLAALGACHRGGDSNELTAEENAQLEEADNMLDASPDGLAVTNAPVGNGEAIASDSVNADDEAPDRDEDEGGNSE